MITGLAKHGRGSDAVRLFKQMEHGGVVSDHVVFVGVLTACNHAEMVADCRKHHVESLRHQTNNQTLWLYD
jgi:pentatricopeptide repeat protein